jgi:hypothetical protein
MTIPQEHIKMLNNVNSATQRAGLGDLLAEIESKAGGDDIKKALNAFREELDGILELISGLENKINALVAEDKYSGSIRALENSVSSLSSKLDKHIDLTKVVVPKPTSPPTVPPTQTE